MNSETSNKNASMPKDLKEKWVAALRSGEYKQGRNTLEDNNTYCCLGVLQMVADGSTEHLQHTPTAAWAAHHACISNSAPELVGYRGFVPYINNQWLTDWNDNGADFNIIADLIEQHVDGV